MKHTSLRRTGLALATVGALALGALASSGLAAPAAAAPAEIVVWQGKSGGAPAPTDPWIGTIAVDSPASTTVTDGQVVTLGVRAYCADPHADGGTPYLGFHLDADSDAVVFDEGAWDVSSSPAVLTGTLTITMGDYNLDDGRMALAVYAAGNCFTVGGRDTSEQFVEFGFESGSGGSDDGGSDDGGSDDTDPVVRPAFPGALRDELDDRELRVEASHGGFATGWYLGSDGSPDATGYLLTDDGEIYLDDSFAGFGENIEIGEEGDRYDIGWNSDCTRRDLGARTDYGVADEDLGGLTVTASSRFDSDLVMRTWTFRNDGDATTTAQQIHIETDLSWDEETLTEEKRSAHGAVYSTPEVTEEGDLTAGVVAVHLWGGPTAAPSRGAMWIDGALEDDQEAAIATSIGFLDAATSVPTVRMPSGTILNGATRRSSPASTATATTSSSATRSPRWRRAPR